MDSWPQTPSAELQAIPESREPHHLEVYLAPDGQLKDVRLDGESVHPTWFKIEWKESGELSAKVKGIRLATRYGDAITIHASP
jgi:hypothetical protein